MTRVELGIMQIKCEAFNRIVHVQSSRYKNYDQYDERSDAEQRESRIDGIVINAKAKIAAFKQKMKILEDNRKANPKTDNSWYYYDLNSHLGLKND